MAISTNGTVIARLAGGLYNTVMSNATYLEVAAQDPSALANTLYSRDFAKSTDLAVATTLITNLGLSTVAGLDNWVAAQLTAAGSAKGAKIVSMLNDFAGMTADTTYGAAATAFNTKVDAALAASQKTGAVEGKFETAGVVAVANATFTLTSGVDSGAAFTGGAGNDTFIATVATLGANDSVDAGAAGTDTLSITETANVPALVGTLTGFEALNITTTGAIGSVAAAAGTNTAAVAQVATVVLTGTYVATDTVTVTIGDAVYTEAIGSVTATYSGRAEAAAKIKAIIDAHASDSVTVASEVHDAGTGTTASTYVETAFTITSKTAGTTLPISVAKGIVASSAATLAYATATVATQTDDVAVKTVTANVTGTAPVAVKEIKTVTFVDATTAVTALKVSINGTDYSGVPSALGKAVLAADVARTINAVLGTGVAVAHATDGTLTITAPTAGTPLPVLDITVTATGGGGDSTVGTVANKAANGVASAAVAVAAPTGVTAYTAAATGVANVSGAKTTDLTVSGTAVQSSSGNIVAITASDSVFAASAAGPVTITTGTTSTTLVGAVALDSASGTAGNATGVYVTGGTTVSITGAKGTTDVKVGAAPYAKSAVSTTSIYPQTNGNSSKTPTGDVSVTKVSSSTSTSTGAKTGTYGIGTNSIYTNGATSVTSTGAASTVITDSGTLSLQASDTAASAPGTSKLATVTLAGLSGTATIKSDAITTVNLSDTLTAQTVTISNSGALNANSGAINFNVSNVGASTVRVTLDDATATSVNVGTLAASGFNSVGTGTATAVSSNSGSKSWITLTTPAATSVTLTNSLAVDIGNVTTNAAKVATVNASGATGAVTTTIGAATTVGMAFTGGSGADTVTLTADPSITATTKATTVALGAGNDNLLNGPGGTGTAAVTSTSFTGASFDGGDGTDVVAVSLITAGNASKFTNFETLGLDVAATATRDLSILAGITGYKLLENAASGGTVTYQNAVVANGLTVGGTAGVTNASVTSVTDGTTVLDFGTTVEGTADAYSITFSGTGSSSSTLASPTAIKAGIVKIAGIEAVTLASGGTNFTNNTIALNDANARTLTLTGAQKATVTIDTATGGFGTASTTSTDAAGVSLVDASAMTGKFSFTASSSLGTAFAGVTIKGGSGDDAIILAAQTGTGRYTVDAGAGDDTITTSTVSSTLTGGAGKDKFVVTSAKASAAAATNTVVTTIMDAQAGDTLQLLNANTTNNFTSTAVDVGGAISLEAAIATAATGTTKATTVNTVTWFVYGPNTYVVEYVGTGSATTNITTTDVVVKLAGVHDLSASTLTTGNLLSLS